MGRKLIVKKEAVYIRRAENWQEHYKRRELARAMVAGGYNAAVMCKILYMDLPVQTLDVDGSILEMAIDDRLKLAQIARRYDRVPGVLLCRWYWSAEAWQEFVRAFQALPDVLEDYYYTFDKRTDRAWLVPVSMARRGRRAVGKPVDNKSTSERVKVQVPEFSAAGREL